MYGGFKGETLDADTKAYRVKVVVALIKTGNPLQKLECPGLRDFLQENGYRLTDSKHIHVFDLMPFILLEEHSCLRAEIEGKYLRISNLCDGTSRFGEFLAVMVCFISDWTIQHRLFHLELLRKA